MRFSLLAPALLVLAGCGDSPVHRNVGTGRIVRTVGPSGAVLRDDGSDALRGFEFSIPAGALDRLVEVSVEVVTDIVIDGTESIGRCFSILLRPDPGPLLTDASLRIRMALPATRTAGSLFVARRTDPAAFSAIDPGLSRSAIAADTVGYDDVTEVMTASLRELGELQFKAATGGRHTEDALQLARSAYATLSEGTSAALVSADARLGQAQAADPFTALPHFLRACTRVLVALDDRGDTGPGIDSVGEALTDLGLDLGSRSLFERIYSGSWPSSLSPPPGGPSLTAIVAALRAHLRPSLELALRDLDRVPASSSFVLTLPTSFRTLPGDRELDTADQFVLRSMLAAAMSWLDWSTTLDLDVQPGDLADPNLTIASFLIAHPLAARTRSGVEPATLQALQASLADLAAAVGLIAAETDAQTDDLVVFPQGSTAEDRTTWRAQLDDIRAALDLDVATRLHVSGVTGDLDLRLRGPLSGGTIDLRAALPAFQLYLPLAGTIADPTLGGVLPGLDQRRATLLVGIFDRRIVANGEILADGDFADWPEGSALLDPADPNTDASGDRRLGVDIQQIAFADGVTSTGFRVTVADGAIGYRAQHATAFVFRLRDLARTHLAEALRVEVVIGAASNTVRVFVDGAEEAIPAVAVAGGSDLEVTLDRGQLASLIDLSQTRVFDVRSEDFDLSSGGVVRDGVRGVILVH